MQVTYGIIPMNISSDTTNAHKPWLIVLCGPSLQQYPPPSSGSLPSPPPPLAPSPSLPLIHKDSSGLAGSQ